MPRYTSAYSALVERLEEVRILLNLADELERKDGIGNADKINALCRGGIVLLSSHIEGYTKEVGELTLGKIYEKNVCRSKISRLIPYHASKDIVSEIRDTADAKKLSEKVAELIVRDSSLWAINGPHPSPISEQRFNRGFASPSFDKIAKYINRFGYSEYKRDLSQLLKADYAVVKNLIDHIVDVRNKIAHGDASISKTPQDLLTAIPLVKLYCRSTDDLFANWCRANLCGIR